MFRRCRFETLFERTPLAADTVNVEFQYVREDVNGDGLVSPIDALIIINFLNRANRNADGGGVSVYVGPPTVSDPNPSLTVGSNGSIDFGLTASTLACPAFSFAIETPPQHGTVTIDQRGNAVYGPLQDFTGTDSFVLTVTDGKKTATVPYTVNVNDPPVINGGTTPTLSVAPETIARFTVNATDDSPLSFQITTLPSHGFAGVNETTGEGTYLGASGYEGTDSFTVTVSDGIVSIDVLYSVTVGNGGGNTDGQAPVIRGGTSPTFTVAPETVANFSIVATDPQNDAIFYRVHTAPQHGAMGIDLNGSGTYVSDPGYTGPDSFVVTVTDESHPVNVTFSVTVTSDGGNDNHAPVAEEHIQWDVIAGVPAIFPLNATDSDGDILSYSFSYLPTHGEYSIDTLGNFRFVGDVLFAPETVTVLIDISDGQATTTIRRQLNSHLPPPEGEGEGEPGDWELGVDAVLGGDLEDILAPTLVA